MTPEFGAPKLIPTALLFGNPERAQPAIAGDGQHIAFLAPDDRGVLNVFVRGLAAGEPDQVTHDRGRGVHWYRWDEDGEHILYLQDSDGDENWHLYRARAGSPHATDLTPFLGARVDLVHTNPALPNEILVALNLGSRSLFDVYRVYLNTGEMVLDTPNPGHVIRWTVDHSLQVRAALAATRTGGRAVICRHRRGGVWRRVVEWAPDDTFGSIVAFDESNMGLFVLTSKDANSTRLVHIEIATGASCVVASDQMYDVSGCLFHPDTHALQAVAFLRARQEWLIVDDAIRPDFAYLEDNHKGEVFVLSRSRDDTKWIVEILGSSSPADFYLYERAKRRTTFLFSDFPRLKDFELSDVETISVKASDGMTLHGFVTVPHWVERRNLPMVLLVHGGPWARDIQRFSPEVQRLANRGYVVLQINFRGSTGYGKEYLSSGDKQWGRRMQEDLLDAKEWMIRTGVADPTRVAIYGFSYGGYAALHALAFAPDAFRCGIAAAAPSNLLSFLDSIPPYWQPQKAMFRARVGDTESDRSALAAVSPFFHAEKIAAPLLLCHGANDPRVPRSESDQLVSRMRALGRDVDYLVFEDEGHGLYKPSNRLRFFTAVEQFLAKHLGGRIFTG